MPETVTFTISREVAKQAIEEMRWLKACNREREVFANRVIDKFQAALDECGEVVTVETKTGPGETFIRELQLLGQAALAYEFTKVFKPVKEEKPVDPVNVANARKAMKEMDDRERKGMRV